MSTDELNTTTQSTDAEGEDVLTIGEVLEYQEQLIEDTQAVLGAADDKNCTYAEGYMKRQALYACLTCIPEAKTDPSKSAGVCLACCYHCHDGHELVELYTKRNFRCDCGNKKFPTTNPCTLNPNKEDYNEANAYNQNFTGKYCTCQRPYPDPEDPISDDMIQCVICEDWYHSRHLGVAVPNMTLYAEVICESCVKSNEFLLYYGNFTVSKENSVMEKATSGESSKDVESKEKKEVEVVTSKEDEVTSTTESVEAKVDSTSTNDDVVNTEEEEMDIEVQEVVDVDQETETEKSNKEEAAAAVEKKDNEAENVVSLESEAESQSKSEETIAVDQKEDVQENTDDVLESEAEPQSKTEEPVENVEKKEDTDDVILVESEAESQSKTTCKKQTKSSEVCTKFWCDITWRQQLCRCSTCEEMYQQLKVAFLLDPLDPVQVYEEKGKVKSQENVVKQEEREMEFLNSLDRVPLLEAIAGYNDMKTHLVEYLRKFAENKKVVREEDIQEFFTDYRSKKRMKCDIPHFCR